MDATLAGLWVTTFGLVVAVIATAVFASPGPRKRGGITALAMVLVICFGFAIAGTVGAGSNANATGPPAQSTAPATAPPPTQPAITQTPRSVDAAQVKGRFIDAANAACVKRFHQNETIAAQVGLPQRPNDFATAMAYMEGTVGTAEDLISAISALERPPGDEQRIETMLSYLSDSTLSLESAIDNYKRFGPQTPKFQQDLDEGAGLEKKWNSAAAVYGLRQCA